MDDYTIKKGDNVTLYSIENDYVFEFKIGDKNDPLLSKICIGKRIKDKFTYQNETLIVQFIVPDDKRAGIDEIVRHKPKKKKTKKSPINVTTKSTGIINHALKNSPSKSVIKDSSNSSIKTPVRNKANTIDISDFIVRTNVYRCTYYNHTLTSVNAIVHIMNNSKIKEIPFPGMYCEKCNKYFLFEQTYQEMKKIGYICCKIIKKTELEEYRENKTEFDLWQNKSILNLYGYSVDKNINLSVKERHDILAFIIENNILSIEKIASYLQSFIQLRKNNKKMKDAISKWQSDINYVLNYKKNNTNIRVNNLIIK